MWLIVFNFSKFSHSNCGLYFLLFEATIALAMEKSPSPSHLRSEARRPHKLQRAKQERDLG